MIPFIKYKSSEKAQCHFIHANGFPAYAYKSLLKDLSEQMSVSTMLLRPHWEDNSDINNFHTWTTFLEDFQLYAKEQDVKQQYGMGHSVGGNIILRAAICDNKLFKSIILLDPTIFIPSIVYLWRLLSLFPKLHSQFPLAKAARNRRVEFKEKDDIFNSYRSKEIFNKVPDTQLYEYIDSIFSYCKDNEIFKINFSRQWEEKIFLKSLYDDMCIWNNLDKLNIPVLILRPESNPVLRNSAAQKISSNKNITTITIKDSTHLFPLEKHEETSQIIKEFLSI